MKRPRLTDEQLANTFGVPTEQVKDERSRNEKILHKIIIKSKQGGPYTLSSVILK